ncbi:MAG: class I SAM-dependent methyltransferase [Chloroflexota bacterium]
MILPRWFLKLAFHLLYYQMAWSYELVAWSVSFGQWSTWRRLAFSFFNKGKTLELAYGTGVFFTEMLDAGHDPVGLDLSPYMARQASRRLRRQNKPMLLSQGKAQMLPFPSHTFDTVVATFPTDYMLQDETLSEIHRVLRENSGRLIIVTEGYLRGPWPLRPFVDWLYDVTDQRRIPPEKPIALLTAHNFTARWEMVEQDGAVARLLIGEKQ